LCSQVTGRPTRKIIEGSIMDDFCYSLRGEIQRDHAAALRADLRMFIAVSEKNLLIDCARLTAIDPAVLAVLCETHRDLECVGRHMRITNPSHRTRRAFEVSGLGDVLVGSAPNDGALATAS